MSGHTPTRRAPAAPLQAPAARLAAPSGGQALDGQTRSRMSARFGHDFSAVRVHTDSRAEEAAQAAGANAFALGNDVVFGGGRYQPGSPETERLLAHELTHVVQQQRFGPGDPSRASRKSDASEQEADRAAADVAAGRDVEVRAAPGAAIARDGLLDMFSKTFGDWTFSPQLPPPTSTDTTHDQAPGQPQANDRAQQQADDAEAAKRAGETDPRPKWWTLPPFAPPAITPPPTFPGLTPPFGPGPGPMPPLTIPGLTPYTPPTFPGLAPPATGGPQLTPPTFNPFPGYQPPLLGRDLPPLTLAPTDNSGS